MKEGVMIVWLAASVKKIVTELWDAQYRACHGEDIARAKRCLERADKHMSVVEKYIGLSCKSDDWLQVKDRLGYLVSRYSDARTPIAQRPWGDLGELLSGDFLNEWATVEQAVFQLYKPGCWGLPKTMAITEILEEVPGTTSGLRHDSDATLPEFEATLGVEIKDGLYRAVRMMVWGGVRYERLTERMLDLLDVICGAYSNGRTGVSFDEISNRVPGNYDGGFYKAFNLNRKDWPPVHPVREIVTGDGFYTLIDPKTVKVPEKVPETFPR